VHVNHPWVTDAIATSALHRSGTRIGGTARGRASGSARQRSNPARAGVRGRQLPLASLDAARKDEILPYIERLRDETRVPIVYVSHAVAEVARLANTLVVLANGQAVAAGPVGPS
jgi:molybdate transport system ATP-binding protein